jgi:tripartite-type tricarboxylate transporter receptor subunit TctC
MHTDKSGNPKRPARSCAEQAKSMKTTSFLAAIAVALLSAASPASAADYPTKSIRLIVPFPPGGTSEVLARSLAQRMGERLGQAVYIENVGGAGSTLGTGVAARSSADGYTLLFGYSSGLTIAPGFFSNLPYDSLKAFVPIGSVARFPMVMVASTSVPVNNLKELVAFAKREPGKLTYATAGMGSTPHLLGEILRTSAGVDITHVPYKGMAPAWMDVGAGRVDLAWDAFDGVKPLLSEGKVKALAVTSATRLPELPNVPTVAEAGFPGLELSVWTGVLAPAGTPPEIVDKLQDALLKTLALPDIRQLFESRGYQMMAGSGASMTRLMQQDLSRYADVIKRAGAKIE